MKRPCHKHQREGDVVRHRLFHDIDGVRPVGLVTILRERLPVHRVFSIRQWRLQRHDQNLLVLGGQGFRGDFNFGFVGPNHLNRAELEVQFF